MFARLSLLTLAIVSVAGVANARTIWEPPVQEPPVVDTDSSPAHGPHKVAITDEYGFRYDDQGRIERRARRGVRVPARWLPLGFQLLPSGP